MKTRIIVDSTANLMPAVKARVHTVPLTVQFGAEEYIDGVTIDHKTFYEKLIESDVLPTTSQATPADFAKAFEDAREAGEAADYGIGGSARPTQLLVAQLRQLGALNRLVLPQN